MSIVVSARDGWFARFNTGDGEIRLKVIAWRIDVRTDELGTTYNVPIIVDPDADGERAVMDADSMAETHGWDYTGVMYYDDRQEAAS
jgi:hypothetical protein